MHIRRGFLGWGVFLILTGAVPLAVRSGYLTSDQIGRLWTLWPLILIGIGVGLILSRTRFDFIGGLIVAATFGLMAGGLLSSGIGIFSTGACGQDAGTIDFPAREGTFSSSGASVDLEIDCGNVTVGVAPGNAWRVEGRDAKGSDRRSSRRRRRCASARATTAPIRSGSSASATPGRSRCPMPLRLDLALRLNAGQATIALPGAPGELARCRAQRRVCDHRPRVDQGGPGHRHRAQRRLARTQPPERVDDRFDPGQCRRRQAVRPVRGGAPAPNGESIVASYDYGGQGLVQDGSTWTTPGFDTAAVRIDLKTAANAGSFVLNPEEGCD